MKTCHCTKLEKIAETQREILHLQDTLATKLTEFYECKGCSKIYKTTSTSRLFEGVSQEFNTYEGPLTSKEIAANAHDYKGDIKANDENSILTSRVMELRNKLRIYRK